MVDLLPKLKCDNKQKVVDVTIYEDSNDKMNSFWGKFDNIKSEIANINYYLDEIVKLDDEINNNCDQQQKSHKRTEINNKISQITVLANKIKTDLDKLKNNIENDKDIDQADTRLQMNQMNLLTNYFVETIQHFSSIRSEIKEKFCKQVIRHYSIAGIEINEDQVNNIIENNPESLEANIFVSAGTQSVQITDVYNKIASRHQDIIEIETKLNELLELFVQFSIVVNEQGKVIDNIQNNISMANKYVKKGTHALIDANEENKKDRRCKKYIIFIGLGVLLIVIIISISVVFHKKK